MLFQSRVDRAQKWLKERSGKTEDRDRTETGELSEAEKLRREAENDMDLEKGDLFAMLVSAFITILPACLLALLIMVSVLLVVIFK